MIFVNVPGYSCATTPATDHAAAACSEGKETPPWRSWPLPLPSSGRCRPNEYFIPSTTTRLFNAASPERNPVSRQCSLCVSWLNSHIPPAPPTRAARDALEMLLYRLIVFGLWERLLLKSLSVTTKPAVKPLRGTSHSVSGIRRLAGLVHSLC